MHFQESDLGYRYDDSDVCVFFGKAGATELLIEKQFSDVQFLKLQQIHSDFVVRANTQLQTADAHWTQESKTALLIATADCMPILIYDAFTKTVAAVHAGWKGISNKITFKCLKALSTMHSTASHFTIWIGPHILQPSFEVKIDVLHKLLESSYASDKSVHYAQDNRITVDLKSIVLSQISAAIGPNFRCSQLNLDTMTTTTLNSYRRDNTNSGRNLSFIYLK